MIQTRSTTTKTSPLTTPVKGSSKLIMKTPNKYVEDNDHQHINKSSKSENKDLGRQTVLVVTKVNVTPVKRSARNFASEKNKSNDDGTIITPPVSVEALARDLRSLAIEDPPASSKTKKTTNKGNMNTDNNVGDIESTPWDIIDDTTPIMEESSDNKTKHGDTIASSTNSTLGRIWKFVGGFRVLRSARLLNQAVVHSA